jgi:phenylalanyl-tRNA synthetase alpha chain
MSVLDRIGTLRAEAEEAVAGAPSSAALEELRVRYLGRKAELPNLLRGVAQLPPEERGPTGKRLNEVRKEIEARLAEARAERRSRERELARAERDAERVARRLEEAQAALEDARRDAEEAESELRSAREAVDEARDETARLEEQL